MMGLVNLRTNEMSIFEKCDLVRLKYVQIVENENGLVCQNDVIGINIPKRLMDDFLNVSAESYGLNVISLLERIFHNAKIKFVDCEDIKITYNLVKSF